MAFFKNIYGHDRIARSLRQSIANNRLSHALIFDGEEGIGKTTMANALAQTLQCERRMINPGREDMSGTDISYDANTPNIDPTMINADTLDACGHCVSCRAFQNNNHPDVIHVRAEKKSIGIDDVREQINRQTQSKPYRYRYKIFIIHRADTMTVQAQNAILKTLEEPPSFAIFILLSENINAFLPTLISRCVVFRFKPLPVPLVKEYLVDHGMEDERADFYSIFSQGNIGGALKLSQSETFLEMRETVIGMAQSLRRSDLPEAFARFATLDAFKDNIQGLLDLFLLWYRDVIIVKQTDNNYLLIQKDKASEIYAEAQATALEVLCAKFDAVWQAKRHLMQNGNFQLSLEMMLLKMRGYS
ncbi:MAG: DNA polymerase III subunit delta' [Clostridiales bacterium]|jgi:DNA polymerase-3 subunit delta'|nr:DNA polymerase III subunit delta' [Clostridiales bacterium]